MLSPALDVQIARTGTLGHRGLTTKKAVACRRPAIALARTCTMTDQAQTAVALVHAALQKG